MPSPLVDLGALATHCRRGRVTPVAFGRMDCSLWAADWVKICTGVDLAADWRGQYSTRDEYRRLLVARGNLIRVAHRGLLSIGGRRIVPAEAEPGDIGAIPTEDGPALAVAGRGMWFAKLGEGLDERGQATYAWRF